MRWVVLLLISVVAACSTTGQHYPVRSWVQEPATRTPDIDFIRLTADAIAADTAQSVTRAVANPQLATQIRGYEYRVGPRDVLMFTVWDHPELTIPAGEFRSPEMQGHLVSAAGEIFFPYVGTISVSGRTLIDIRKDLTGKLSQYITNPQLDVRVAAFRSKRINVTGHVSKPGFFALTDAPMTLVDAVDLAGGATPAAAIGRVQLLRDEQLLSFDLLRLLKYGDLRQNLLLQDGDVVFVPENSNDVVHVMGSVKKPGALGITAGRLNLAEAITRSDGFDAASADTRRVFVFRNKSAGPAVYWLDAKSPDAMLLATQFALLPQDVVFVASSALARWNRAVNLVLPTIQSLWQTQSLIDRLND